MHTETEENVTRNKKYFLWGMILSMFCWGLSWTSGKVISHYADAGIIGFYRFALTTLSILLVLWIGKINVWIKRQGFLNLFIASSLIATYSFLFFQGLMLGKAGAGAVLVTILNPVISYIIMLSIKRRLPNIKETLGLTLGVIAGIILLSLWKSWDAVFHAGNSYFLLAALTWAVLSVFTSKASQYGSPIAFSFWMYGIGGVLMFLFIDQRAAIHLFSQTDAVFWGNMFFSATITTALATTFFFVATTKIGPSRASSFIFMVPFSATLGSWLLLSEIPTWNTIVGGVIGICAVWILNKK